MALVVHPTIQHIPKEYVELVYCDEKNSIYLGNKEACKPDIYDAIISIIDPDIEFQPIQQNHFIFRIYDHSASNIKPVLQQFIECITQLNGSVLVHCGEGISRSPTLLIGYFIQEKGFSYNDAFDLLQRAQPNIKPNRGFNKFLKSL
jgi:hypothetical protein